MTVLVSTLVLLLAGLLFAAYEIFSLHFETSRHLSSLAQLLASGAVQPLSRDDRIRAQDLLAQAAGSKRVVTVYLLDNTDRAVAHYIREASSAREMDAVREMRLFELEARQIKEGTQGRKEMSWFEEGFLGHFVPIWYGDYYLGSLYLRADLELLSTRLLWLFLLMLLVLGGSIALSFRLANHFQQKLASAITGLAGHMQRVVSSNRWQPLEQPPISDEFKTLFDGFNELMSALDERDDRLKVHQDYLEEEVRLRTNDLQVANDELLRAKAHAEKANEAKSLFLANVSHEIRTPMVGVLGMADLLRKSEIGARQRELAETVHRSAQALMCLLEDLLDVSKIEAGKLSLAPTAFNLRQLAEDVVVLMAPKAFEKGVDINLVMAPSSPEIVEGDAGRIRQMLLNLVGNAVKFTQQGAIEVCLWHLPGPGNGIYHLEVNDTGIGISPHLQQKIFESFQQGDATEGRRFGGTGLGLAIVRELSVLMGGDVQVTSAPGQGSRFTLRLPLRIVDAAGFDPELREHLREKPVLVAVRQATTRRAASELLGGLGMQVRECASSSALLEALKLYDGSETKVDLVVDRTSWEALPEIFDARAIRTAVVLQQPGMAEAETRGRKSLALQHILLPVQLRDLAEALVHGAKTVPKRGLVAGDGHAAEPLEPLGIGGGARILVAEDNPDSQKLLTILLTSAGYDVTLASNGSEALQEIGRNTFDLTFMDCQMPVLDGYEATREMRQRGITTPIIALTAFSRKEEYEKCLAAGMDDYLSKPFRQNSLYQILAKWGVRGEEHEG